MVFIAQQSGMTRHLRPATFDEIPRLETLIARSGRGLSLPFYTAAQAEALTTHVFGVDSQLVADGTYLVIEQDGHIVACGGWSRRRTLFGGDQTKTGSDPLLDPATEPARIRAFFVDPAYARQGLGRALMDACTEAARAAGFTTLALVSTLPGEPLYRAAGFEAAERFDLALPGPVRAPVVRMHRVL
ncbi:MAG: GNAT family N-acetyltransferase [Bacteroidota bacterium]